MRLIDADALLDRLNEEKVEFNATINDLIIIAPTIEAEPVVRCKDCTWHNKDINQCRRQVCAVMYADDFCKYGERRDEQEGTVRKIFMQEDGEE